MAKLKVGVPLKASNNIWILPSTKPERPDMQADVSQQRFVSRGRSGAHKDQVGQSVESNGPSKLKFTSA
jgi:hypothetical protein